MAFLYITAFTPRGIAFGRTSEEGLAPSDCAAARDYIEQHISSLTSLVLFRDEEDAEILLPGNLLQQSAFIFQVAANLGDVKPPKGTFFKPVTLL